MQFFYKVIILLFSSLTPTLADIKDFSFKELLIQNPLLPPRYVLAVINNELLALGISGTSELSTTTKLKVGSEIMQVYAELSDYQKNDLENHIKQIFSLKEFIPCTRE